MDRCQRVCARGGELTALGAGSPLVERVRDVYASGANGGEEPTCQADPAGDDERGDDETRSSVAISVPRVVTAEYIELSAANTAPSAMIEPMT